VQRGSSPWCEADATVSSSTYVFGGPRSQKENLATVEVGNIFELACNTEVTYPTAQISSEVGQTTFHGDSTAAAGEFLDAVFEGDQFLRCDLDRHTLTYKTEPQVFAAQGWYHAALVLVDNEFKSLRKEPLNRCEHALGASFTTHEDLEIVGVSHELQSASFKFLV